MDHFFNIPELLRTVFSHLDTEEIQPIVTVSQQWSASALDVLWEEVENLSRVCHVLAPLELHSAEYHFSRSLKPDDWIRLDRYASRVQRLKHSWRPVNNLASSVFDQLARARLRMDIFPNLQRMSWNFRLTDSLIFIHQGMCSLAIELSNGITVHDVDIFFSHLVYRSPNLANLFIKGFESSDAAILDAPLTSVFETLLNLRDVSVGFTPSKGVLDLLARLPLLEKAAIGHHTDSASFGTLDDGVFQSLRSIALSFSYAVSSDILARIKQPSLLDHIYINSPVKETSDNLNGLLKVISEGFQDLMTLHVTSLLDVPRHQSLSHGSSQKRSVAIEHLRPVLNCGKLRSFEIGHHRALRLLLCDLEEITTALPHLETLILNCSPTFGAANALAMSVVEHLMRTCPNLRRLGLYLDASVSSFPTQIPRPITSNLRTLYVGSSKISNPRSVASFLNYVCPHLRSVVPGRGWVRSSLRDNGFKDEKWEQVASMLCVLTDARAEERAWALATNRDQVATLECEIERLQLRVAELEGAQEIDASDTMSASDSQDA